MLLYGEEFLEVDDLEQWTEFLMSTQIQGLKFVSGAAARGHPAGHPQSAPRGVSRGTASGRTAAAVGTAASRPNTPELLPASLLDVPVRRPWRIPLVRARR